MKKTFFLIFIVGQSVILLAYGFSSLYFLLTLFRIFLSKGTEPQIPTGLSMVFPVLSTIAAFFAVFTLVVLVNDWRKKKPLDRALMYACITWCISSVGLVLNFIPFYFPF